MANPKDDFGWVDDEPAGASEARRDSITAQIVVGLIFALLIALSFLLQR